MEPTDLEQKILKAAEELFMENGFNGVSTTDIARKAGCNQALVHYYYRTKDRLFYQIYLNKIDLFLSYIDSCGYPNNFKEFLKTCIGYYFDFLNANRKIPFFILNELVLNEERRKNIREQIFNDSHRQKVYYFISEIVQAEINEGRMRNVSTFDLLINILSMVAMTFITLPVFEDFLQKNADETNEYIANRKEEIITFVLKGLCIE